MTFSARDCNAPRKAFGLWWLSQFRRWGLVKGTPDYQGIVKKVVRTDLYLEAMKEIGVTPKVQDMQKEKLFDGSFDPADPEKYARSFAVNSLA
jgi:nitrate/nitrite transport system substrate-binding protein